MAFVPTFALALAIYWIAASIVRLAFSIITLPLAAFRTVTQSRVVLDIVRSVVALACGGCGFAVAVLGLHRLGFATSGILPVAIGVAVTAAHLLAARRFLRTRQFTDDLFSLAGELGGIAAAAIATLHF